MRVVGPGRLVVVGGHSRGVGKTTAIEHLLRASPNDSWAAVKISAHRHTPGVPGTLLVEEDREGRPGTQTARYLAAGARQAWLCHAADAVMPRAARFVAGLLHRGVNVIVESNRIVQHLEADTTLFVLSPALDDWKTSSGRAVAAADAFVLGAGEGGAVAAWPTSGGRLDGRPLFTLRPSAALDAWYEVRHSVLTQASQDLVQRAAS
jgi:hypothetical protein